MVFVADSQRSREEYNKKSLADLKTNLKANRIDPDKVPLVLQYNKQDLRDLVTVNELNADLNDRKVPAFNAVAIRGKGVLETLAAILKEATKAAIASNGTHFSRLNDDELNATVEKIFAPYLKRASQLSGEVRPVTSRYKEVRLSSRDMDPSARSDGPIRGDLTLEPLDLLSRSVGSSIVIAEDSSQEAKAADKIEKMRKDLAVLGELTAKACADSDFDQVHTKTVDLAIENTAFDCGSLLLINDESKTMGEKILRGLKRDPLNAIEIKSVGTLAYQLAQRKEAILTHNVQDRLFCSNPSSEMEGIHGLASYPLVAKNFPLGLINLYATRPGKLFGQDEELFLTILSHILGLYLLSSFYALKLNSLSSEK